MSTSDKKVEETPEEIVSKEKTPGEMPEEVLIDEKVEEIVSKEETPEKISEEMSDVVEECMGHVGYLFGLLCSPKISEEMKKKFINYINGWINTVNKLSDDPKYATLFYIKAQRQFFEACADSIADVISVKEKEE